MLAQEVVQQFGVLFAKVVEDPILKQALVDLLADLCRDPAVMAAVNELTQHILGREDVYKVCTISYSLTHARAMSFQQCTKRFHSLTVTYESGNKSAAVNFIVGCSG